MTDEKTGLAEAVAEACRIVEARQSKPTTFRAFGREFTAEEFMLFTIDFLALHRLAANYAGETPEEWLRRFGQVRKVTVEDVATLTKLRDAEGGGAGMRS